MHSKLATKCQRLRTPSCCYVGSELPQHRLQNCVPLLHFTPYSCRITCMSGPGIKRRALPRLESDEVRDDRTGTQIGAVIRQRIEALEFLSACLQGKAFYLNSVLLSAKDVQQAQANSPGMMMRAQAFAILAESAGKVLAYEDGLPALRAAA